MSYAWDFQGLLDYRWVLLSGLGLTLGLTVASTLLGLTLGTLVAMLRLTRFRLVSATAFVLTELFRCTPMLVQLIWFYYALPILIGVSMSAITAAVLTLTLYGASFYRRGGPWRHPRHRLRPSGTPGARWGWAGCASCATSSCRRPSG